MGRTNPSLALRAYDCFICSFQFADLQPIYDLDSSMVENVRRGMPAATTDPRRIDIAV